MPYSEQLQTQVTQALAELDLARAEHRQLGNYNAEKLHEYRHIVYDELREKCAARPEGTHEKDDDYWEIHHRLSCEYRHIGFPAADGHKDNLPSERLAHKFAHEDMECMAAALSAAFEREHASGNGSEHRKNEHHRRKNKPLPLTTR